MSDHCPACEIGDRILSDELVSEALYAYQAKYPTYSLADCALHLARTALALPAFGWIATRQVTEYIASPKLEAHRTAEAQGPKQETPAPKPRRGRKASALRLVGEAPTV